MKLWILKARMEFAGYASIQNIVVRACSEKEARGIAAHRDSTANWFDPLYATCDELSQDGEKGIIIEDNNGG